MEKRKFKTFKTLVKYKLKRVYQSINNLFKYKFITLEQKKALLLLVNPDCRQCTLISNYQFPKGDDEEKTEKFEYHKINIDNQYLDIERLIDHFRFGDLITEQQAKILNNLTVVKPDNCKCPINPSGIWKNHRKENRENE